MPLNYLYGMHNFTFLSYPRVYLIEDKFYFSNQLKYLTSIIKARLGEKAYKCQRKKNPIYSNYFSSSVILDMFRPFKMCVENRLNLYVETILSTF